MNGIFLFRVLGVKAFECRLLVIFQSRLSLSLRNWSLLACIHMYINIGHPSGLASQSQHKYRLPVLNH